jgi:hypothetical protein
MPVVMATRMPFVVRTAVQGPRETRQRDPASSFHGSTPSCGLTEFAELHIQSHFALSILVTVS